MNWWDDSPSQQFLSFFDFGWTKKMIVDEVVLGFHSRLDKIIKVDMSDELKDHLLLRQVDLDSHDRNFVIGDAGGVYSLQTCSSNLWNAYRSEGLPVSLMTTDSSANGCRHISRPRGGRGKRATRHSRKTEVNSNENKFYIFLSPWNNTFENKMLKGNNWNFQLYAFRRTILRCDSPFKMYFVRTNFNWEYCACNFSRSHVIFQCSAIIL